VHTLDLRVDIISETPFYSIRAELYNVKAGRVGGGRVNGQVVIGDYTSSITDVCGTFTTRVHLKCLIKYEQAIVLV